jgi:chromosome segregation ATPase
MLASRLAESTAGTCASTSAFQKRIETLVQEKAELKKNVDTLTVKISSVLRTLSFMAKEHDRILRLSMSHQDTLQTAKKYQDSLAAKAARSEQMLIDAAWEREEIVKILTRQAQEVEKSAEERKRLMDIVREQNAKIEQVCANRSELVGSIHKQKSRITSLKNDIQVLQEIASDDISVFSEDSGDMDTITPSVARVKDQVQDAELEELIEPLNQSSINGSQDDISSQDRSKCYNDGIFIQGDNDAGGSNLESSFDESMQEEEDGNDENKAESSVDMLCNEAARLVASMPAKQY